METIDPLTNLLSGNRKKTLGMLSKAMSKAPAPASSGAAMPAGDMTALPPGMQQGGLVLYNHHGYQEGGEILTSATNWINQNVLNPVKNFANNILPSLPQPALPTATSAPATLGTGLAAQAGSAAQTHNDQLKQAAGMGYAEGGEVKPLIPFSIADVANAARTVGKVAGRVAGDWYRGKMQEPAQASDIRHQTMPMHTQPGSLTAVPRVAGKGYAEGGEVMYGDIAGNVTTKRPMTLTENYGVHPRMSAGQIAYTGGAQPVGEPSAITGQPARQPFRLSGAPSATQVPVNPRTGVPAVRAAGVPATTPQPNNLPAVRPATTPQVVQPAPRASAGSPTPRSGGNVPQRVNRAVARRGIADTITRLNPIRGYLPGGSATTPTPGEAVPTAEFGGSATTPTPGEAVPTAEFGGAQPVMVGGGIAGELYRRSGLHIPGLEQMFGGEVDTSGVPLSTQATALLHPAAGGPQMMASHGAPQPMAPQRTPMPVIPVNATQQQPADIAALPKQGFFQAEGSKPIPVGSDLPKYGEGTAEQPFTHDEQKGQKRQGVWGAVGGDEGDLSITGSPTSISNYVTPQLPTATITGPDGKPVTVGGGAINDWSPGSANERLVASQAKYRDEVQHAVEANASQGIAPSASQVKELGLSGGDVAAILAANNKGGRFNTAIATNLEAGKAEGQKALTQSEVNKNNAVAEWNRAHGENIGKGGMKKGGLTPEGKQVYFDGTDQFTVENGEHVPYSGKVVTGTGSQRPIQVLNKETGQMEFTTPQEKQADPGKWGAGPSDPQVKAWTQNEKYYTANADFVNTIGNFGKQAQDIMKQYNLNDLPKLGNYTFQQLVKLKGMSSGDVAALNNMLTGYRGEMSKMAEGNLGIGGAKEATAKKYADSISDSMPLKEFITMSQWAEKEGAGRLGSIQKETTRLKKSLGIKEKQQEGRTIVRTGTLDGKKVIQYSDGTVEYAS